MDAETTSNLLNELKSGDRRALAKAITLVESTRPDHREQAVALVAQAQRQSGKTLRIGVSGVPGVGKSTFIEALGKDVISQGHKVAVLAVDPSSPRTGGSIMGDKTRMEKLAASDDAFVRPSPTGGTLGGVARRTRESIVLCEAAGFDVVIVETVGVGQSETAVANLVDVFVLLLSPGGGDELQGLKKGVVELADILVVNKADGELKNAATQAQRAYRNAITMLPQGEMNWKPPVLTCSSTEGAGIDEVWESIEKFKNIAVAEGLFTKRREAQARQALWEEVSHTVLGALREDDGLKDKLSVIEEDVAAGKRSPGDGAQAILSLLKQA